MVCFSFCRLIATPGRFLHLAVEMELKLHTIEYVVFDEADRYVRRLQLFFAPFCFFLQIP